MATRLEIVNGALAILADERLETFDDDDPDDIAQSAQDLYPMVKEAALLKSDWSWLYERMQLTHDPNWGSNAEPYRYRFELPPTTTLRALYRTESATDSEVEGWRRQGRYVYANVPPIWYDAQRQGIDESQWPPAFVYAMMRDMCAHLAFASTWDEPTTRTMERRAMDAYNEAKRLDAQGTPNEAVQHFDWDTYRVGGYGQHSVPRIAGPEVDSVALAQALRNAGFGG